MADDRLSAVNPKAGDQDQQQEIEQAEAPAAFNVLFRERIGRECEQRRRHCAGQDRAVVEHRDSAENQDAEPARSDRRRNRRKPDADDGRKAHAGEIPGMTKASW